MKVARKAIAEFLVSAVTIGVLALGLVNPWDWPWYGLIAFAVGGLSTGIVLALLID